MRIGLEGDKICKNNKHTNEKMSCLFHRINTCQVPQEKFEHSVYQPRVHTDSSCMRGSRKRCQRGSNSDNVFFFFLILMRGTMIQNSTTSGPYIGPPAKRHLNGVSQADR